MKTSQLLLCGLLSFAVMPGAECRTTISSSISAEERLVLFNLQELTNVITLSPATSVLWQHRQSRAGGYYQLQASNSWQRRLNAEGTGEFSIRNQAQHNFNFQGDTKLKQKLNLSSQASVRQILRIPSFGVSQNPTNSSNQASIKSVQAGGSVNQRLSPRSNLFLSLQGSQSDLDDSTSRGLDLRANLRGQSRSGKLWWQANTDQSLRGIADDQERTLLGQAQLQGGTYLTPAVQGYARLQSEQAYFGSRALVSDAWRRELGLIYEPGKRSRLTLSYFPDSDNTPLGIGLFWKPTPRTSADLNYQSRSFGDSWQAQLSHATRLLRNSLSYNDTLSSFDREVLAPVIAGTLLCPATYTELNQCELAPLTPGNQPVTPGPDQVAIPIPGLQPVISSGLYRLKSLALSSALQRSKTTLSVSVSVSHRTELSSSEQTTEQILANDARFAVQVTPALTGQISLGWLQQGNIDEPSRMRTLSHIGSEARLAMSPQLSVAIKARGQQVSQGSNNNYDREASIGSSLTYSF